MSVFTFHTRVSYDDIDSNMNLTLKGALGFMQEAALIHSGQSGYSATNVDQTHVTWMLIQWRARLVNDAGWNEPVAVNTWPRSMNRATSIRNFEIWGQDDRLIAIGESNWVLVHADTGRIIRIPPEVASAYDLVGRDVFSSPLPDLPVGGGEVRWEGLVSRRDIDTNHHVNNRVYLDYAREALPEELSQVSFREVSVRYRKQLLLGDIIRCRYSRQNESHIVDICGEDLSAVHGTVVFLE